MIFEKHEELSHKYEEQAKELEAVRIKSSDRRTAALILLISQVVLAIGVRMVTESTTLGVLVLLIGILLSSLAIYLTTRHPEKHKK